jgi:hypothetical protein
MGLWLWHPLLLLPLLLPCCRAALLQVGDRDATYLVATDRVPALCAALTAAAAPGKPSGGEGPVVLPHTVLHTCTGADLAGVVFKHPTHGRTSPILCGTHVTNDSGTGYALACPCAAAVAAAAAVVASSVATLHGSHTPHSPPWPAVTV